MESQVGNVSVTEERYLRVRAELLRLGRVGTVMLAIRIGRVIVDEFFNGDIAYARRVGTKHYSIRRLAREPELPFSASTLWRSVALFAMACRSPELFEGDTLSMSHFRAVTGLPDAVQVRLLSEAAKYGWPRRVLEGQVRAYRLDASSRSHRRPPGRPAVSPFVRAIRSFRRTIEGLDAAAIDPEDVVHLRDFLGELTDLCGQFEHPPGSDEFRAAAHALASATRESTGAPPVVQRGEIGVEATRFERLAHGTAGSRAP